MHLRNESMPTNSATRRLGLSIIACVLVVDLIWFPFSALRFATSNLAVITVLAALYLLSGPIRRHYALAPAMQNFAAEVYILVLFGAVGFPLSYLVIGSGLRIQDDLLVAVDNALGFDWPAYTTTVLQNDLLHVASLVLYVMTPYLVGYATLRSCLKGNVDRASQVVLSVILGGVLCVIVSGLLPSAGASGYFVADDNFYSGSAVVFNGAYKQTFFDLRDGTGMEVFLLIPAALIAFPSYHACLCLLVVMAFRNTGILGNTILVLNVGTLLSLPVQGGHHLSDVLGGLLVGTMVFRVVRWHSHTRICR